MAALVERHMLIVPFHYWEGRNHGAVVVEYPHILAD